MVYFNVKTLIIDKNNFTDLEGSIDITLTDKKRGEIFSEECLGVHHLSILK